MIGKKETTNVKINTILGNGAEFQGDFTTEGSARVDGAVDGNVKASGTLIIGATGRITGNIEVEAAVVGGEVQGNIAASERVELTATAKVLGDISTKVIVIDEHAIFQGRCDMNQDVSSLKRSKVVAKAGKAGKKSAKAAIEEALKEVAEEEKRESDQETESKLSLGAAGKKSEQTQEQTSEQTKTE